MAHPVNPYCSCDPCECAPLCLCQLTLTRRYTDVEWDDRYDELVHTVVERYAPVAGAERVGPAVMPIDERGHAGDGSHNPSGHMPVMHTPTAAAPSVPIPPPTPAPPSPGDINDAIAPMRAGQYDVTGGLAPQPHDHESTSVRSAEHNGHTIQIETTYRILIDGEEFPDPIHVQDDGTVHYHGLPQYSTASAVDLLKVVVDKMSDDALPPLIGGPPADGGHSSHGHGGVA